MSNEEIYHEEKPNTVIHGGFTSNEYYIQDTEYGQYPRIFAIVNGFVAPDNGTVTAQVIGTGATPVVTFNQTVSASLNNGNAVANGVLHEFPVHVLKGEFVSFSNCTVRMIFFQRDT